MAKQDKYELKDRSEFHEDEPIFTFRAQDAALPAVLETYAVLCQNLGCDPTHVEHVRAVRMNVQNWQTRNPEKVKIPD